MDIFPIWQSTYYVSSADSVKYRIKKAGQEICTATAVRLPDEDDIRIGLNKPCQNYVDSIIDMDATGDTPSNAYAEFSLEIYNASNNSWFEAYQFAFVNDWSYGAHDVEGSYSEPINGHAAPGQLITYSVVCTGVTAETICYEEYDFNAYLTVSPSTLYFDQTGGTATITIFANADWTITDYNNLVTLSQYSGHSGTTTVTVSCGVNRIIREFTDTLRIRVYKRGTVATEYVHITQEAATPYVTIISGDNALFDNSGSTWTVRYDTNIPRLYYEMSDGTNTITGYTSGGRISFELPAVTGTTDYTLSFYDEPNGTLYATAEAEQTIFYFNFITADNVAVAKETTAYTVTWDTNYPQVTYVFGNDRVTTSDTGVTLTFPANTGESQITYTIYVYNDRNKLIGTLKWRQLSIFSAQYLTLVTTGFTGTQTLTLKYKSCTTSYASTIYYSTDNGTTWEEMRSPAGGYGIDQTVTKYISVSNGDKVFLKKSNSYGGTLTATTSSGYCDLEGNYMSVVYGDNFEANTELTGVTYANMVDFRGSIKNAKNMVLPASVLEDRMCESMFEDCSMLETAPVLPATQVCNYTYFAMFKNCSSLREAPELPATVLHEEGHEGTYCYGEMFYGCVSLTRTPVLPAVDVPQHAYEKMFYGCRNLNRIESYAESDEYSDYFATMWASGVSETGTFIQSEDMYNWLNGPSGNPWYYIPKPVGYTGETGEYNTQYTTLDILTGGTLQFCSIYNLDYTTHHRKNGAKLFYSVNGDYWYDAFNTEYIEVEAGDEILLKGIFGDREIAQDWLRWSPSFSGSTASFNVRGNAMSLLYGDNFREETNLFVCSFAHLFESTNVVSAFDWELPTGYYPDVSVFETFYDCPLLTDGPLINCTSFGDAAFTETFYDCTSLQTIRMPKLVYVYDGFARWVYNVPEGGTFTKHPDAVYPTTAPIPTWIPNGIPEGWTVVNA